MITLLDYGAGNVRSVVNALEYLGGQLKTATGPEDIDQAESLLFPGVGNFGALMRTLRETGLKEALVRYLRSGRPFFGICVALQALYESSEEAPEEPGLGLYPGTVQRFPADLAVPHIGWNGIRALKASPFFAGLAGDEKFYFVHSYRMPECSGAEVLAASDYGSEYVSAAGRDCQIATQFHPEKSGRAGLRLLENFLALSRESSAIAAVLPSRCPDKTELARRVIACLDVRANDAGDLVVTKGDQYDVREAGKVRNLGKPVALAADYYQQGADEITFLNITGFRDFPLEDQPMLRVLEETSKKVFVPLTIGGGIRDFVDKNGVYTPALAVAARYFRAGADKVSIGSDAVAIVEGFLETGEADGTSAIEEIARVYGNQAVVISIDPRRVYVRSPKDLPNPRIQCLESAFPGPNGERLCWYECTVKGGREGRPVDAVTLAQVCEQLGAGEILLNCIDRDGTGAGFDLELVAAVKKAVGIPVIASSGAGATDHFVEVFTRTKADAALAAGIFHRKEVPIAAVKAAMRQADIPVRIVSTAEPGQAVRIEPATEEDLREILALQYLAYQSEAKLWNNPDIPPLKQTLDEVRQEYRQGLVLKAVDADGVIIGSVRCRLENNTVHIGKLMVHPARQKQGLGTRLLLAVEQFHPGKRYELFTSSKSAGNIRLYEKLGYTVFDERQSTGALRFVYLEKGAVGVERPTAQS